MPILLEKGRGAADSYHYGLFYNRMQLIWLLRLTWLKSEYEFVSYDYP